MMEDEENSSFHGSLSPFAYIPPSSLSSSSSLPPRHDQPPERAASLPQAASTPCSIEEGGDNDKSSAPPVSISRKRGENSERRRTDARSGSWKRQKLGNAVPANIRLSRIPDHVAEGLDVLFCGINPGRMSAVTGHHYANPTNHFWHCLHLSGFTPRLLLPSEDCTLPGRYNLGLINLVDRPSASEAELSAQEMASSVPALLTKIAHLRPRVACFVGKGIWLHIERALRASMFMGDATGTSKNAQPTQGAPAQDHVAEPAKTPVALKDGRSIYFHSVGDTPVIADMERSPKAEPERHDFWPGGVVKPEESMSDFSSKQKTISEIVNTTVTSVPSSLPHSATRRGGMSSAPRPGLKKAKAPSAPAFAYGLQPYKAVHNTAVPHSASVGVTLFCVFPSTSGRVVSHQRGDKVALFKALRENIERVKAGTLDTGSMRIIHLRADCP